MTPGTEVVHEGAVKVVTKAFRLPDFSYVVELWTAELGLQKAYVEGTLAPVTIEAREMAAARGWSVEWTARYLGAGQYWDGMMAAWKRNKRGRREAEEPEAGEAARGRGVRARRGRKAS